MTVTTKELYIVCSGKAMGPYEVESVRGVVRARNLLAEEFPNADIYQVRATSIGDALRLAAIEAGKSNS